MNASLFDTLTRFIGSRTSRRDGTAEHHRAGDRRGSVLWSKTRWQQRAATAAMATASQACALPERNSVVGLTTPLRRGA